jgi:EAL domain-containing protein (putative c-di-GMP-specific phosphodiesterase class I)
MAESLRLYTEYLPTVIQDLSAHGSLALILMDFSPYSAIEEAYGFQTYNLVRNRILDLLEGQSGREFRKEDILAMEHPEGLRILLFVGPKRESLSRSHKDLESMRQRMLKSVIPNLARTAFPYLKKPPKIDIGYGIGIHNPLLDPHHIVLRTIREAVERARWQHETDEMESLQHIRETILNEQITTMYQPIVGIHDEVPMGYEALTRGISGGFFQSADELFDAAIRHRLLVELDRICRKRALVFSSRLPGKPKIFINTLPATIRDPEFQGSYLITSLEQAGIAPDRIVIEITEKLVIDNLSLFLDSMSYFTSLGMSLAVDDVGSGYSGLETIGKLKPSYLKLDASLVHDVHVSAINREMLKAILQLGRGIGAKVIAEGIETPEELRVLRALGVDYGQGYLLGRPKSLS